MAPYLFVQHEWTNKEDKGSRAFRAKWEPILQHFWIVASGLSKLAKVETPDESEPVIRWYKDVSKLTHVFDDNDGEIQ